MILFARGSQVLYSAKLKLLTILEKKVLKTSGVSLSLSIILTRVIYSSNTTLTESKDFIFFQKDLLS